MSSLHDILAYTCAYAWLGSSGSLIDDKKFQPNNTFGAEWGGLEGIGNQCVLCVCVCICLCEVARVCVYNVVSSIEFEFVCSRCGAARLTDSHQQVG